MSNEEENCRIFSVCRPESRSEFEYYITKFAASHNVDFANCPGGAKIERENNLKEFKSAYDIDSMPKSGAGSEYGREQREEARRKKYGIRTKNYNPNDQPFILKLGAGKQQKRLKGTKNGGVSKNTNYVAFALIGPSKFVSLPVGDWYDFTPMPKYKALNAEEAEEQFSRRDKTYNHFAIMCSKKYNKDKDEEDQEKETKSGKGSKRKGPLMLTEFELMSGSEEEDSEREEPKEEDEDRKKGRKKRKHAKEEEDEVQAEAQEENDDADEGQELDYLSLSSDDEDDMFDNDARDDNDIYKDVGVAEEEGLKKLGSDDDEDEEGDEDKKDDDDEDDEDDNDKAKGKVDSDSGSDIDSETDMTYMPPSKASSSTKSPTGSEDHKKDSIIDKKRKSDSPESKNKKQKLDDAFSAKSESPIEEIVKKQLLRKPSTTIDLLKKLTSKPLLNSYSKEEIQALLFNVMKKLKVEKKTIGGITYFYLLDNNNKS